MKSKKNLVGMILGGIGALTGIGLFTTGCNDAPHYENVTVTVPEVEACCGTDQTSQEYNTCVQAYQANGVCSSPSPKPDDPLPDVPLYGMPDPIAPTPEQLQECCGQDDGTSEYKACVENYTDVNAPHECYEHEPIAIYGPDPTWCCGPEWNECSNTYFNGGGCTSGIDPEESQACCAKAEDPGACVLDFIKTKKCPTNIPEPTEEELKNCCIMSNFENDAECEKKYKETGVCDNEDMLQCCNDNYDDYILDPEYPNARCVDIMRQNGECSQDLKDCCQIPDGTYDDTCVERYYKKGSCDSDYNACCKKTDGNFDKRCVDSFNKKGQCDTELIDCCKSEDGSIDRACDQIMEYTKECINDKDELACCSKYHDEWDVVTVSFTCIKYYKKTNPYNTCAQSDYEYEDEPMATIYGGDFRPTTPFEWCDDYKGDYEKCLEFARCDVNLQEEEAKQCCGEDDKAPNYAECMKNYQEKGKSEDCINPLNEGEPAPNTNPLECCGKHPGFGNQEDLREQRDKWQSCKNTYVKTGECTAVPGDTPDE